MLETINMSHHHNSAGGSNRNGHHSYHQQSNNTFHKSASYDPAIYQNGKKYTNATLSPYYNYHQSHSEGERRYEEANSFDDDVSSIAENIGYNSPNKLGAGERHTNGHRTSNGSDEFDQDSEFQQLNWKLKNDPDYVKKAALGKIIGYYNVGQEVGSGNFSQVRLGTHLLTKVRVAIKILDKTKLDEKTQRLLLREISSMEKLHHPNIIRLYEVIHTMSRLYICMEYAPDGELFTRINEQGKISEAESKRIFSQILSAVNHMHNHNIIHRDIKAENVFFSNSHTVKLGDFGFSIQATPDKHLNTYCGSPPYAAPELFRDDSYIGIYVDIWALGVLLYFMVTSLMPFKAETVNKLKRLILTGDYFIPGHVSDSCQLLIRGILKPVPADRFTIREIMDSAWLDGEKFTSQLEPYQLNPTLDKSELKKEEIRAREMLESLGITHEYLVYSNLRTDLSSNGHSLSVPASMGMSGPVSSTNPNSFLNGNSSKNGGGNSSSNSSSSTIHANTIINKGPNLSPIGSANSSFIQLSPNLMSLSTYKHLQTLITDELKQSINGTYRIIFHRIQKEMRKEITHDSVGGFNSLSLLAYVKTHDRQQPPPLSGTNKTKLNHLKLDSSDNLRLDAYKNKPASATNGKNGHRNYDDDSDGFSDDNSYEGKKPTKNLMTNKATAVAIGKSATNPNLDVFVRLNSQNNEAHHQGAMSPVIMNGISSNGSGPYLNNNKILATISNSPNYRQTSPLASSKPAAAKTVLAPPATGKLTSSSTNLASTSSNYLSAHQSSGSRRSSFSKPGESMNMKYKTQNSSSSQHSNKAYSYTNYQRSISNTDRQASSKLCTIL